MATKRKGAAGVKPAASIPEAEMTATPAKPDPATETSSTIAAAVVAAVDDGAIKGVATSVASALDQAVLADTGAAVDAAKANDAQVIFAQQPGQTAQALSAPSISGGAPEGGVTSKRAPREKSISVSAQPGKTRWRIGRQFSPEAAVIALSTLSDDELERLKSDPQLTIKPIED